jgi:hypothetical protein
VVDKVEIVPNPSAREDPEGAAGIINLVLKQKADAGTSGALTLAGGTTGLASIGGNLGYQSGPLSFYGSYGFVRDRRPRTDALDRENTYLDPITYLEEAGARLQLPLAHTLTGSATYALGQQNELSADMVFTTRTRTESYGIQYRNLDSVRAVTGLSDRLTRGTNHQYTLDVTLAFKHVFPDKGHKLSGELRLLREEEGGPSSAVGRTLALDGTPGDTSDLETQTGWEHPNETSWKVDYTQPLSSVVRMEAGYKGSLQGFHTTLGTLVFDTTQAVYLPDSTRTSDLTYDQLVNAAYSTLAAQPGKFLLQGGVRIERATTQFRLRTTGAAYNNGYNSAFSSALIAYNIDDSHQVKLSYSTRIQRPDDTDLLDPTRRYSDPLNVTVGNPYLKPQYVRALELGLQRTTGGLTVQVTPFFRHTLDAVRPLRTVDSAGVVTTTFANIATSDAYGVDGTVALSGGRLSGFASVSAFGQVDNAANVTPGLSASTFGWTVRANASLRISPTLDLQTLLSYQAPMTVVQGRVASRTRFSLAARQKLLGDRMSLTLRVIDPFNTSQEISTTIDPQFYQVSNRRRAIRGLVLSATWTFGKPQRRGRDPADLIGPDGSP